MNSREAMQEEFEAWWNGRQLPENMKAAFFMVWQTALSSQEPTLKNNEFIPDSTEGRIQAAIKCLNMHWVSHDANRFDYAIEGLEKCLAALASQAQQESVKLPPEWEKNVTTMWRCVRHNDCSIPSDDLDLMRSMLLSFIPPAPKGDTE